MWLSLESHKFQPLIRLGCILRVQKIGDNMETLVYYKVNVPYPVGVRFHMRDAQGRVLTVVDPYVAVKEEDVRDFKRANRYAINNGLIVQSTEPSYDDESPNMLDDEKVDALVKNYLALKNALPEITSVSIIVKILDAAKDQNRPTKTLKLIEARLAEFEEESPYSMKGVE
jgi:hypothetical protein